MNSWWDVKLEGTELASISQVLESGFLNEGPITEKLETRFSVFLELALLFSVQVELLPCT